jgi:hypothetical protein
VETSEIIPGIILAIPAGSYYRRPWCLKITSVMSVSRETGAVDLLGEVLGADGTTARKKRLLRRTVIMPDRAVQFMPRQGEQS